MDRDRHLTTLMVFISSRVSEENGTAKTATIPITNTTSMCLLSEKKMTHCALIKLDSIQIVQHNGDGNCSLTFTI